MYFTLDKDNTIYYNGNKKGGELMYLKTKDVAGLLKISEQTLMKWRLKKEGPPYVRLDSGMIRYPKQGVIDYLKGREHDNDKAAN